jgi:hypothetical protein
VYLRVLKNTLARRAVAGTPFEGLSDKLVGPLIYGISKDPVHGREGDGGLRQEQRQAGPEGRRHARIS